MKMMKCVWILLKERDSIRNDPENKYNDFYLWNLSNWAGGVFFKNVTQNYIIHYFNIEDD